MSGVACNKDNPKKPGSTCQGSVAYSDTRDNARWARDGPWNQPKKEWAGVEMILPGDAVFFTGKTAKVTQPRVAGDERSEPPESAGVEARAKCSKSDVTHSAGFRSSPLSTPNLALFSEQDSQHGHPASTRNGLNHRISILKPGAMRFIRNSPALRRERF